MKEACCVCAHPHHVEVVDGSGDVQDSVPTLVAFCDAHTSLLFGLGNTCAGPEQQLHGTSHAKVHRVVQGRAAFLVFYVEQRRIATI
jgi:hypothetical protein